MRVPAAGAAGGDELVQGRPHGAEIPDLGLDLAALRLRFGAHVGTVAVAQFQQLADLLQAEAQLLGALDEHDAVQGGRRIMPEPPFWFGRLVHQSQALVIADRLDVDAGRAREPTDCQGGGLHVRKSRYTDSKQPSAFCAIRLPSWRS